VREEQEVFIVGENREGKINSNRITPFPYGNLVSLVLSLWLARMCVLHLKRVRPERWRRSWKQGPGDWLQLSCLLGRPERGQSGARVKGSVQ
jgi:hypothetical protein